MSNLLSNPTRFQRKANANIRMISASSCENGFYCTVVFNGGKTKTFRPSAFSISRFFDVISKYHWHSSIEYHNGLTWYNYFNPAKFEAPRVMSHSQVVFTSAAPVVIPNV